MDGYVGFIRIKDFPHKLIQMRISRSQGYTRKTLPTNDLTIHMLNSQQFSLFFSFGVWELTDLLFLQLLMELLAPHRKLQPKGDFDMDINARPCIFSETISQWNENSKK
jgi:hypothetical protein